MADLGKPISQQTSAVDKADARFERGLEIRRPWEGTFQECYDYAMPSKTAMWDNARGQDRSVDIFDETAVVAVPEFANRLQSGLIPPFAKWSKYTPGAAVPKEQLKEVEKTLEGITEYAFEVIHNSNFNEEAHEAFHEIAIGTASMAVVEGDYRSPIHCKAIPIPQLVIDRGPNDSIDMNGFSRMVPGRLIDVMYPNAKLKDDTRRQLANEPDKDVEIREACWREWETAPEIKHQKLVWLKSHKEVLESEVYNGEGSNPFITFRWAKLANEVWGRGPLLNALPAIKTANLTVQLVLENAEMAIAGFYTAENDGVINVENIRIEPGTIVPVSPGSRGLQAVGPAGKFDIAQLVLQDMRANIKRALYNEMLGNPDRTPKSATEVNARMADLSRMIGSSYGRLHSEFVQPFLRRVLFLLRKQGLITLPSINNQLIKVNPQSPLSRAQQYQEVEDISNYVMLIAQMFGPQLVNVFIKGEEAAPLVGKKMGIPSSISGCRGEIEGLMKMMQEQMAQQQGAQNAGQPTQGQPQ